MFMLFIIYIYNIRAQIITHYIPTMVALLFILL